MVLFKSCRDVNQIAHFLHQIYPKTYKTALEAYKDAVSSERDYLVIDLCCETHDNQRLRSGIFQKTRIIFINEPLAKKRTNLAFVTKSPCIFAKAYFRQSIARVNTLSL